MLARAHRDARRVSCGCILAFSDGVLTVTGSTDNPPYEEKRSFDRLDKSFSMRFKVLASDCLPLGELNRQGQVCDIGAGGLRFISSGEIRKNEQLLILLEFSGWKVDGVEWIQTDNSDDQGTLKVLGRVMWCGEVDPENNEQEVGVSFLGRIY